MNKFDEKLTEKILPKFNSVEGWSDLMPSMKYLKENVEKFPDFNMTQAKDKILLAKRLAQSLNPGLPAGLHEITLEVYDIIFDNIRRNNANYMGSDLGLYSSGLFPFFQFASVQNKTLYLTSIIKKHYLELSEQEFLLCLPGFIVSILPGLDDQNENLIKQMKEILFNARKKAGDSNFYGHLWSVILRTERMRLVGMKYICETIPIYKVMVEAPNIEECMSIFYPNLTVLVVNALCSVIEDESVLVQRLAMDFVITHFPLHNTILSQDDKVSLLISGLNLLVKNDYSTSRRLFSWLVGGNVNDDIDPTDPHITNMVELLILSIQKIFNKKNSSKEKILNGLKILDQLFKQQVTLVDFLLSSISIDIISSAEAYCINKVTSTGKANDEVLIKVKKMFEYDPAYQDCLWQSLVKKLSDEINQYKDNFSAEIRNTITLLRLCLSHISLESSDRKIKYFIPIISNLLKAMLMLNIEKKEQIQEIKSVLVLALSFLKNFQEPNKPLVEENSNNSSMIPSSRITLQKKSSIKFILHQGVANIPLLESIKENIKHYQNFYIKICTLFYDHFMTVKKVERGDLKIFKDATELMIRIQEYSEEFTIIPEWVFHLEKIVMSPNIEFSLEGISQLLEVFLVTSDNLIYASISSHLLHEEPCNEIKLMISSKNLNMNKRNMCELTLSKLWNLIEQQTIQKPVIDLILKFYKTQPKVFTDTISKTFTDSDLNKTVTAIKQFSQFWKLANEYYPDTIFFEEGECIFNMLDFLDNDHPLLRHLSKSWLSQSLAQFNKIIDPILRVLLAHETKWYISLKKQLYFSQEYDNKRILHAFRKLKNIIINGGEGVIKFLVYKTVSQSLLDLDEIGKELIAIGKAVSSGYYLDLLVNISLRFIEGKFIEAVSEEFYIENFSVNAAACEFLEFLLSFVEPKSKIMAIAETIAHTVLNILHQSIMSNDEVMQVQLLNLLKVVLFNTIDEHQNFKQQAINIFNSQIFNDCINLGIRIEYLFVRSHFISFLELCLPIFSSLLDYDSILRIANKLILSSSDFLVERVIYYLEGGITQTNLLNLHDSIKFNQSAKTFLVKNYLEEYKEEKYFDENDLNVILRGLAEILFHFMDISKPVKTSMDINWQQFKKIFYEKSTSSFADLIGGFFSNKDNDENAFRNSLSEIGAAVFDVFEQVLASIICCWVNWSDMYMTNDFCLNENGIIAFNYEEDRFSRTSKDDEGMGKSLPVKDTNKGISNQLKYQIGVITLNLFLSNPYDFMRSFLSLWLNEKSKYIVDDKQYKLSMIELLVSMNIPMEVIVVTLIKNINANRVKDYKKSKVKVNDIYPYLLNLDQCTYEAKICHLVYSYLIFSSTKVDNSIVDIWNQMLNFIAIFMESKSPTTYYWLFEIIALMEIKLPLRETSTDASIKKKLSAFVTVLFTKISDLSVNNRFEAIFDSPSQIVLPLTPSIYRLIGAEVYGPDISLINVPLHDIDQFKESYGDVECITPSDLISDQSSTDESIRNFYRSLFNSVSGGIILNKEESLVTYRIIGFITLKSLFYPIMKNTYLPDRNEKMGKLIQTIVKNILSLMNERVGFNHIYIELATDFLHNLMTNASYLTSSSCKTMLMDFFLFPDFLKMSRRCLRLWKDIIREFSQHYHEIIVDLLDKFDYKSMRRVSFIIYSCAKDTHSTKLGLILEKVKKVITTYSENPKLEVEIFLMIRIMFLRFSHENLIVLLRDLWPLIFTELVNVILEKKKANSLDLSLSSFKIIELLSVANMEEFCQHQWIFLLDTYDVNSLKPDNPVNLINTLLQSDPRSFRPFSMNLAGNFNTSIDLVSEFSNCKSNELKERGLIMQLQTLTSKDELANFISQIFFYIGLMNNFRSKIDWAAIEGVIENDFLNLTN